jgi:hypothetical protein
VRSESGGRRTEKQPTGRGPKGCVENGPATVQRLPDRLTYRFCFKRQILNHREAKDEDEFEDDFSDFGTASQRDNE